ncbi:hypothetical protein THAOC_05723 [Thalassiosira oceanica]|uniref:Uncharacterized protein n=1 Tax=Thalassiosira oceanica TaxID=159749 RepID=K0T517_THAOC|nr:hypothetical protein THAOC_05723 [Thalassiosira oceanica]|eukprot:EJK72715.1 hypothetical protein THAOC_05723 [Thalassiosira oceanica]
MGMSNSPQVRRTSDDAPPLPASILRKKSAGPRKKKSPGRIVQLIVGAKRAISEDLRRPLLRRPPQTERSKAGWSCIKPEDRIAPSKRADSRTDREGDDAERDEWPQENVAAEIPGTAVRKAASLEMVAGTSAAPTDDDPTPRYVSVAQDSEDLSPIQDDIRDSEDAPPSEAELTEELRTVVLPKDEDVNWESRVDSDRGSDRGYGCGDLVLTDAMFWGEETRQAFARVLETLADCVVSPTGKVSTCDGDDTGDSKNKAAASTAAAESLHPGVAEMEAREDCRGASETCADENGSREDGGAESVYIRGTPCHRRQPSPPCPP